MKHGIKSIIFKIVPQCDKSYKYFASPQRGSFVIESSYVLSVLFVKKHISTPTKLDINKMFCNFHAVR